MKNQTKIIADKGVQELFIIREFNAPRELVFKAFTDPDLLLQWLGPCDMTMEIDYLDNRTGGSYRFIHRSANGQAFGFNGAIHEINEPERMIRTFEFEGLPERGHVVLETATFDALPDNRTKLTIQSVFRSIADRDGMVASGMEYGVNDSHNKLDELLEKQLV
ncbi:MAG TPA: SRPBCC family protein [Mucilaginibacter sp.]|jgi:uncharacterized protein YndB with AHSA1/START domain